MSKAHALALCTSRPLPLVVNFAVQCVQKAKWFANSSETWEGWGRTVERMDEGNGEYNTDKYMYIYI